VLFKTLNSDLSKLSSYRHMLVQDAHLYAVKLLKTAPF
jgi:hypothetical protein